MKVLFNKNANWLLNFYQLATVAEISFQVLIA